MNDPIIVGGDMNFEAAKLDAYNHIRGATRAVIVICDEPTHGGAMVCTGSFKELLSLLVTAVNSSPEFKNLVQIALNVH